MRVYFVQGVAFVAEVGVLRYASINMKLTYRALNEKQARRARFIRLLSFVAFMGLGVLLAVVITVLGNPYGMRPSGWPWSPADWYGVLLGLLLVAMLAAGTLLVHFQRLLHVDVLIRRKSTQIIRFGLPMMILSLVFALASVLVLTRLVMVSWFAASDGWRPNWVWTSPRSNDPIVNVAFAADSQSIFVWFKSGKARSWLVGRGREVDASGAPACPITLSSTALAQDKSLTAAGVVLDVTGPSELKIKLKDGKLRNVSSVGAVTCLALSADGELALIGAKDGFVDVWDTANGKELRLLKEGKAVPVSAAALAFDKQVAASGYEDGKIRFWNLNTGNLLKDDLKHAVPVSVLAFDSTGNRLVSMANQSGVLLLWDARAYKMLTEFNTSFRDATHLAVSPDGRYAIVAADSSVHLLRLTAP
jgi:hypothetical protein